MDGERKERASDFFSYLKQLEPIAAPQIQGARFDFSPSLRHFKVPLSVSDRAERYPHVDKAVPRQLLPFKIELHNESCFIILKRRRGGNPH